VGEPVVAAVADTVQVVVVCHTPAVVGTAMSNIVDCMVAVAVVVEGGNSNIAHYWCMIGAVGLQVGVEEGRPKVFVDAEHQWHPLRKHQGQRTFGGQACLLVGYHRDLASEPGIGWEEAREEVGWR